MRTLTLSETEFDLIQHVLTLHVRYTRCRRSAALVERTRAYCPQFHPSMLRHAVEPPELPAPPGPANEAPALLVGVGEVGDGVGERVVESR